MNPLFALLIMFSLIAITTTAWYVTLPVGSLTLDLTGDIINSTANLDDATQANVNQTFNLEGFALVLWGPLLDIVYVAWFVVFGSKDDSGSEYANQRGVYYG